MPVNPSSDRSTETEYHNRTPEGVDDLRGLLMRLQMKEMTPMNPGKDSYSQRQQLYEQFALVAMLIKNQTPETRIQFIDIARLLKPDIYPSIDKDHIVKIFVKWIILKPKAEQLQKNPQFMSVVYDLLCFMELYQRTHKHIYQYIPHYDPIEIDSSMSLAGGIYGQETPERRLFIRDVCLELAMTMKETPKIRVQFLNLAYYFEPTFRTNLVKRTFEDNVKLEIQEQWRMMQNLIDFSNHNVDHHHKTKTLLEILQRAMDSYTVTPAQSHSYTAHKHHKSRVLPTVIHTIQPTNYGTNPTRKWTYPEFLKPRNIWRTRNELASQEITSDLAGPVDQVRPCHCAGCKCRGCECCNSCGQDGRCRCVHDPADAREV